MKKILPYILIVFTLVNFLTPIGIGLSRENKIVMEKKVALAGDVELEISSSSKGTEITADVTTYFSTNYWTEGVNTNYTYVFLYDEYPGEKGNWKGIDPVQKESRFFQKSNTTSNKQSITFSGLEENKTYYLLGASSQINYANKLITLITEPWNLLDSDASSGYTNVINVKTGSTGGTQITQGSGVAKATNVVNPSKMPACGIDGLNTTGGTVVGCLAQGIYYVLFVPTSYVFALAGNFFDWAFAYSVNDNSYRSGFVVQGWGVVRDFCNMFFIFILLYVAFNTILGTGGAKTKEMIINVIIIGLLINFSLFATQVVVDASNILARVFYNSNAIVITESTTPTKIDDVVENMSGGITTASDPTYKNGIIPLSSALVNKVNPQSLVINAEKVTDIETEGEANSAITGKNAEDKKKALDVGTFILVTLMAVAINVTGFMVFVSVSLIFVYRVIGIWLAMILAPLAFFSYIVPELKKQPTIGFSAWISELLKLSFVAPIFIFFLYLILKFLETDLVFMTRTGNEKGIMFVIITIVPFVFIMVLLWKAKGIAVDYSGKIGATLAKAGPALGKVMGGATLGLLSGGAALAGSGIIGGAAARMAGSASLQTAAGKTGFKGAMAKLALKGASGVSKAGFDVRETGLGKLVTKQSGMNLDKIISKKAVAGGYAGIQDRKVKRDAESSELLKQSVAAGAKQDAEAKAWNDAYMADMINKRESTPAGVLFDETKHRENYIKANGPKKLTSDEENKRRLADKASEIEYGAGYTEEKEKERLDALKKTGKFNEAVWRKGSKFKDKKADLSDREIRTVKDLRSKSGLEKPPLNAVEIANAEKIISKGESTFKNSHQEIEKINEELKIVSNYLKKDIESLTKADITDYLNNKKEVDSNGNEIDISLNGKLAEEAKNITKLTQKMNGNITDDDDLNKYRDEINDLTSQLQNVSNDTINSSKAEILRLTGMMSSPNANTVQVKADLLVEQQKLDDAVKVAKTSIQNTLKKTKDLEKERLEKLKEDIQKELVEANKEKARINQQISTLNSSLSDKRTHENIKKDATRTVNENKDMLYKGFK